MVNLNYITLDKRKNLKNIMLFVKNFGMENSLKTSRTSIWENNDLQISIDRNIIRILVYDIAELDYYRGVFKEKK